ncbi:methyltransferase [Streptomyces aidingensis]|uniref:Methyltransferase domain-containing protein n=1 Tax=Streptomyces aidingensis TaxID=910347 RepID=A0A1I1NT01_9ACTN|nr:class I SAM-dependent methyltransferase [Streptomyces aidingensis]SFD00555.1 Methyltransferase domain-containing protein [Streptomyces aidingensis]
MTPTLIHHDETRPSRARDWAEIQERMFVPLYDAVYERLAVGRETRLLELGCGTGLALLRAAARGAQVTGTDTDPERLRLARERLLPEPEWGGRRYPARLLAGTVPEPSPDPFTLVTVFGALPDAEVLRRAAELAAPGTPVVLTGWGAPQECAVTVALGVGARLAGRLPQDRPGIQPGVRPGDGPGVPPEPPGAEAVAALAREAGLHPSDGGEVSCPFGYPGLACALRGLLATGSFDSAVQAAGHEQVAKELAESLHPYVNPDGTVWLPNTLTYLIAHT